MQPTPNCNSKYEKPLDHREGTSKGFSLYLAALGSICIGIPDASIELPIMISQDK